MANTTYTVVKGDTLSKIASKYNTTVDNLVALNHIADPNYIVVGQVLIVSGKAPKVKKNTSSKANVTVFGLQSNTTNTIYACWAWDKKNTENYQVRWYYDTGDGVWFQSSDSEITVNQKQATYTAPDNAKAIQFTVRPVSKMRKVKGKEVSYWTASWSTTKIYDFINNPPTTPPTPSVSIEDYRLTAKLENLDVNATSIQFKVVQDDITVYKISDTTIGTETNSAQYACIVTAGSSYKVACRSVRSNLYSDWSEFSSAVTTIPSAPTSITVCKANSETSAYLEWEAVNTATSYNIEYATKKEHFDYSGETTTVSDVKYTHYEVTGLESGSEYYFRIRAVNNTGESGWSPISGVVIGKEPSAPTTWSSTTTVIVGETLNLYWVHNAQDESSQTYAELELIIDGVKETKTIQNSTDDDEKDKTSVYSIATSTYKEGCQIQWRVRTAGVTKIYGDWSVQRTVDIYAQPTLALSLQNQNGSVITQVDSFPFYISALAGPKTQSPIGYHVSIAANDMYTTVDDIGNTKIVSKGQEVYSKYFDISSALLVEFAANNVDLENNISYTATCAVTMNSGLRVESTSIFSVAWTDMEYEPTAEVMVDMNTLTAYIHPYCEDYEGNLISNLYLSVYRREFDGSFTEIIKNVDNSRSIFVSDPHPSLDYARYRIVATDKSTGAVSYCDLPGYPVGEKAIIIQWNEESSGFDTTNEDEIANPLWSGSLLRLPYNVDVSDDHSADVSMVEYIGRKRPVSYYGTQLGETATWNVVIEKSDKDTLYALRRLAIWMGDVYVREPSGSGYWAHVSVSFSQKHADLTIPVTLKLTRVEGGM